jgi:hypothetical protein
LTPAKSGSPKRSPNSTKAAYPKTPKSGAGRRTVAFPDDRAPEIRWHVERFAESGKRGFVSTGPKGGKLRRSNFHKSV